MADEDHEGEATVIGFPFKVKIQGYGTVTPPAETTEKGNDNG